MARFAHKSRMRGPGRRQVLRWLGASALWVGCGDDRLPGFATGEPPVGSDGQCIPIPDEAPDAFAADGTPDEYGRFSNLLEDRAVQRSDIRPSWNGEGAAEGVPLSIELTLLDTQCSPREGYAIYVWQCDRDGAYSLYGEGITLKNYLRGVQVSNGSGQVRFSSIFPGCSAGRWPHFSLEIFRSWAVATAGSMRTASTRIALPKEACDRVYASPGYEQSAANFAPLSLASDPSFADGYSRQLANVTGDPGTGYTASLTLAV